MSIHQKRHRAREHGMTLIETVAYFALFTAVVGFAIATFYEFWDNTKRLRSNADDIVLAVSAGERWRADVRTATGTAQLTVANGVEQFRVPSPAGEVTYTFANGEIRRQAGPTATNTVLLSNVKSSQMKSDARDSVAAWRWELELKSARRNPLLRPLFTFECAAGSAANQ